MPDEKRALEHKDPWQGFCAFVETVCSLQAADQGFADLMTLNDPGARNCRSIVIAPNAGIVELIHRAKATGRLRDDFVAEDLVLLQMANSGVLAATGDTAP